MYCDYCGKRGATYEVAISEDEAIHLCWFCEKRKDEIAEMFKGEKKIGCQDCKYFREDTIHQSGYGSVHHYSCKFPVIRKVKYPIGIVEEEWSRGVLEKPRKECEDAGPGQPERWNQIL